MPRLKDIRFTKRATYIRIGKNETEIPGGKAEFREWIRSVTDAVSPDVIVALQLREHMKTDREFDSVDALFGKDIEATPTVKAQP